MILLQLLRVLHQCSWGHLFNAKGDSLDLMWPSGPHLSFGLLALLGLIGMVEGQKRCESSFS